MTGRRFLPSLAAAAALAGAMLWPATGGAGVPLALTPSLTEAGLLVPSVLEGEAPRYASSVALSADGSTALVGAPGDNGVGSVFAFTRSGASWAQQGPKLVLSEEPGEREVCENAPLECGVGAGVALSADGNIALIGAPRQDKRRGAAWLFVRSGGVWSAAEKLTAGPEERGEGRFGRSVAISADGVTVLVGAPGDETNHGSAWVFKRTATGYVQQGPKLIDPGEQGEGYFGRSVALSADAGTALVGSPADEERRGSATVFVPTGETWNPQGAKLAGAGETGEGRFGYSVALSAGGSSALVGGRTDETGVGGAWAFTRSGGEWTQQGAELTAPDEVKLGHFGASVALSASGDTALIGAPNDTVGNGAAWLFARSGNVWTSTGAKLHGAEAEARGLFGWSVALAANEGAALVGAPRESSSAGSAWSFLGTARPAPTVASVSPGSGPSAGGTPVTITGTGFLAGASVAIGGVATDVQVVSETEITAVTPAGGAGAEEVVVSDLYGTSSGGPKFDYTVPAQSASSNATPRSGALSSVASALPAPKLGVSGNIVPLKGVVRVELPGSHHFILIGAAVQVPFGTIIDARFGQVAVTTAGAGGVTQTAIFYEGEFKLTQSHDGTALATLLGGDFSTCPTATQRAHGAVAATTRRKAKRKLWSEVHGSYSTKGNYATGAALGTRWLTEDFCDGTLIAVASHRVKVTNLVTHHSFMILAGHRYFAKAP